MHASVSAAMRGRMVKREKERREGETAIPDCPPASVSHMGETVTGNSLFAAAPGWNDKGMKKCKPEIHSLIIPQQSLSPFYSRTKYQTDRAVDSATGTAIPQESRDIYQSPSKQDLIGIKSYMAEEVFPAGWAWRQFGSSKISRNAVIVNSVRCWQWRVAKSAA